MLSSLYFHKISVYDRLLYTKLNIYYTEQSFLDPRYIKTIISRSASDGFFLRFYLRFYIHLKR